MHDHRDDDDDHDRGLAFDLETISRQMVARRRALAWLGGAGVTALLAGCGGGSDGSGSSDTTSAAASSSSSSSSSSSASSSFSSTSSTSATGGSCIADPSETAGPYPADGTNTASGSTSNVLTQSGIVRSDIRRSFISNTDDAGGVLVTITLTLVQVSNSCTPLSGYAIYFWQVDRQGNYSLYGAATESYLRGVQVTDSNGQVTFVTYFPAAYSGRYPHIHFEVYSSVSSATTGRNAVLTSQLAMPATVCNAVYADSSLYPSSASNFASVSLGTDGVFGDDTSAQIAQMTPAFTGSIGAGYVATATIGI